MLEYVRGALNKYRRLRSVLLVVAYQAYLLAGSVRIQLPALGLVGTVKSRRREGPLGRATEDWVVVMVMYLCAL